MFSIRWLKRLSALGACSVVVACAQMPGSQSPPEETAATKPASACRAPDGGLVADNAIKYKCVLPGQGITDCQRYACQRCINGTWGGEYTCQLPLTPP